jgi:hypothetical protein
MFGSAQSFQVKVWFSGFFVFGFMVLEGNFFCTELGIYIFWSDLGLFCFGQRWGIFGGFGFFGFLVFGSLVLEGIFQSFRSKRKREVYKAYNKGGGGMFFARQKYIFFG